MKTISLIDFITRFPIEQKVKIYYKGILIEEDCIASIAANGFDQYRQYTIGYQQAIINNDEIIINVEEN